jgi:hypothetical protein
MDEQASSADMTIGQLGHRPGLHVEVNVEGKTVGGVSFETQHWVPGVIVSLGGEGTFVTIEFDTPIGTGERRGLLRREEAQRLIAIDDPGRIRVREMAEVHPDGVPSEIAELVRAGKKVEAIKRYRALNGATVDEARAFIEKL